MEFDTAGIIFALVMVVVVVAAISGVVGWLF